MVEVLLATYNGERFLREQIESIFAQEGNSVCILARDDGSTDATPQILADYSARYLNRFRVVTGPPTGGAKTNFAALMRHATASHICFADQDDVWFPQKVRRSLDAMLALETDASPSTPLLVFSDLSVVDDQLNIIHPSMWSYSGIRPQSVHQLNRLLGVDVVTGCTMMINRAMLQLAFDMPAEATMHDAWIALLASAMGASHILHEPQLLYRQHAANVLGVKGQDHSVSGQVKRFRNGEKRRADRHKHEAMAEALLRLHGHHMPPKQAAIVVDFLRSGRSKNPLIRLWLTVRRRFFRETFVRSAATMVDLAWAPSEAVSSSDV